MGNKCNGQFGGSKRIENTGKHITLLQDECNSPASVSIGIQVEPEWLIKAVQCELLPKTDDTFQPYLIKKIAFTQKKAAKHSIAVGQDCDSSLVYEADGSIPEIPYDQHISILAGGDNNLTRMMHFQPTSHYSMSLPDGRLRYRETHSGSSVPPTFDWTDCQLMTPNLANMRIGGDTQQYWLPYRPNPYTYQHFGACNGEYSQLPGSSNRCREVFHNIDSTCLNPVIATNRTDCLKSPCKKTISTPNLVPSVKRNTYSSRHDPVSFAEDNANFNDFRQPRLRRSRSWSLSSPQLPNLHGLSDFSPIKRSPVQHQNHFMSNYQHETDRMLKAESYLVNFRDPIRAGRMVSHGECHGLQNNSNSSMFNSRLSNWCVNTDAQLPHPSPVFVSEYQPRPMDWRNYCCYEGIPAKTTGSSMSIYGPQFYGMTQGGDLRAEKNVFSVGEQGLPWKTVPRLKTRKERHDFIPDIMESQDILPDNIGLNFSRYSAPPIRSGMLLRPRFKLTSLQKKHETHKTTRPLPLKSPTQLCGNTSPTSSQADTTNLNSSPDRSQFKRRFFLKDTCGLDKVLTDPQDRRMRAICDRFQCDLEIYSKVPKSGYLQYVMDISSNSPWALHSCVRALDSAMNWCLTAQLTACGQKKSPL